MFFGSLLKTQQSCDHSLRNQKLLRVARKLKEKGLTFFYFKNKTKPIILLVMLITMWKCVHYYVWAETGYKNTSFDKKKTYRWLQWGSGLFFGPWAASLFP